MKRIKTTISGFDELIQGGFPENSCIYLSGKPGTGKTIFSLQYLYGGAYFENEVGIYFSFEEKKDSLYQQADQFGWDLKKLEKDKKIKVITIGYENISLNLIQDIFEIIKDLKAKRIIIDSISTLAFLASGISSKNSINEFTVKNFLYSFITKFRELEDVNVLFIGQEGEELSSKISNYICDGIISISYEPLGGSFSRILTIPKMRKTKNDEDIHPLEISPNGIIIHNLE